MANGLLELLTQKMGYLTQRQAVIADNIANANTPNFKPRDLVSFDQTLQQVGDTGGSSGATAGASGLMMKVTNAMHINGIGPGGSGSGPYKTETEKDVYETKPSGNGVVMEQQMTELAQNYTDYSMVTGLYHSTMSMIKTALSRSSS